MTKMFYKVLEISTSLWSDIIYLSTFFYTKWRLTASRWFYSFTLMKSKILNIFCIVHFYFVFLPSVWKIKKKIKILVNTDYLKACGHKDFLHCLYLTVLGLKIWCSCCSGLSACSASSNNLEMTSLAGLCTEEEHTGFFTSWRSTRYLLSTWHSLASKAVYYSKDENRRTILYLYYYYYTHWQYTICFFLLSY